MASPDEVVTATGWRVVGRAVDLVSESAKAGLSPPAQRDVCFAATFRLRPRLGANPAGAILPLLDAALRSTWPDLAPIARGEPQQRSAGRVHAMHWDVARDGDRWCGELLWRHPHPTASGTPCTTHVILAEQPATTFLGVRVALTGGAGAGRALLTAQARPAVLSAMARATLATVNSNGTDPISLDDGDIEAFVERELLAESRDYPVAVLSPTEAGDYLVAPAQLADELLGIAPLFVLARHRTTFGLTDALGDRRLSAYWGALRVYLPGFSCADWSDDHPLLRNDIIGDPLIRAETFGTLAVRAAGSAKMPPGVDVIRGKEPTREARIDASPQVAQSATDAESRPATVPTGAPSTDTLTTAASPPVAEAIAARLDALASTVQNLAELNSILYLELVRLRTTSAVRAAGTASLERRMVRLDELVRRHFEPAAVQSGGDAVAEAAATAEDDGGAASLVEIVRQASVNFADSLLVLDAAERAAADSPYEDVDRAAVVLEAMALVSQRRREGRLGVSLREAFRELGVEYRRTIADSTSKKLRQQYVVHGTDGVTYDCDEHIVLGSSYDPRHCLRIYFTSRAPNETRFVVGHVGRHFDVATTS